MNIFNLQVLQVFWNEPEARKFSAESDLVAGLGFVALTDLLYSFSDDSLTILMYSCKL